MVSCLQLGKWSFILNFAAINVQGHGVVGGRGMKISCKELCHRGKVHAPPVCDTLCEAEGHLEAGSQRFTSQGKYYCMLFMKMRAWPNTCINLHQLAQQHAPTIVQN